MKKTLIAIAVSTATLATGVNAAEVYNEDGYSLEVGGRAEARASIQDGKADDKSRARLNVKGMVEINDDLYGIGFWESEYETNEQGGVDGDDSSSLTTRNLYAGIGGSFGELVYGKTDGALGVITDFTDIMAYHGNSAAHKIAVADRSDNMLSYKVNVDNFDVKASYRFADRVENDTDDKFEDNNEDGYSVSAIYQIGDTGVKLGAGYAEQGDERESMGGISYTINNLYFAATITDGKVMNEDSSLIENYEGYEFAASYTMDKLVLTTTYNNAETEKVTSTDSLALDASYYFKPNFFAYASYEHNMLDKEKVGKIDAEDEFAIGVRFDF